MQAVDDVDIKFQLAHSVADVGAEEVLDKRYAKAKRSSAYAALKKVSPQQSVQPAFTSRVASCTEHLLYSCTAMRSR